MTPRVFSIVCVGAAAVTAFTLRQLRREFQFVVVTGESMSPTFRHGDLAVGRRRFAAVSRGDVVVFTVRSDDYEDERHVAPLHRRLKRAVAVGGDPAPAFISDSLREQADGFVPSGHIALAGDAPVSESSAQFGFINVERIESVVVRRVQRNRPGPAKNDRRDTITAASSATSRV